MSPAFERVHQLLKRLPGLGYRSAERIALHLLVEKPDKLRELMEGLAQAAGAIRQCRICGHLSEASECEICQNPKRDIDHVCIVETIPDLVAIERAGAFSGRYHVLHGKLSPIHKIGPEDLNLAALEARLAASSDERITEITLALSNDIEAEATCHYLQSEIIPDTVRVTRIGFGLPNGGGLPFVDAQTLKSALDGRRDF